MIDNEGKLTRENEAWLGTQGNCEQDLPFFFFLEHLLTKSKAQIDDSCLKK